MKRGGGKQKGSGFEREVCKHLSLWWTNGKQDNIFWRSAMSGGRATVAHKKGKSIAHVAGDLCAVHELGNSFVDEFYVEIKFYKDLKLDSFLFTGAGVLAKFWLETVKRASQNYKLPVLIAKQNLQPSIVLTSHMPLGRWGKYQLVDCRDWGSFRHTYIGHFDEVFRITKRKPKLRS